jgi:hypothetical protein
MAGKPLFEYSPLDESRGEIRLLLYSPNVDNVEIPCKLIHCSINDAPSYMALSYTWGPPQPAHQIFVNEKRFSVRSNLWHFLNSLPRLRNYSEGCSTDATRRPETDNINAHEHVFWVDAVCINQDDVAERNLQVPRMKQIYENAESTLIWLGGDAPGSPARQISNIAFRFLGEVTRRGHRDSHELRRWINFDRGSEGTSRPESSRLWKSRWQAFDALCRHEYWTRTWIIQEVLLAKTVVLCGSEMMQPWSSFEALCRALDERPRPPLGYSTRVEGAVGKAESIPLQLVNDRIHRSVSSNRQLRRLLEAYSSSRSTITHDKIYGLLGLAEKSSDIQVDYSKDCLDLYLDTLEHVKPFRGTLGFCRLLAGRLNVALEYAELNNRARKRQMDGKSYFVRAAALCYGKVLDASFEWDRGVLTLRMRKLWNQTWHQNYPGTSQCHLGRAEVALRKLNTSVNFEESECLLGKSFAWLSRDKEADEGDLKMLTTRQRPLDISAESDAVGVQAPSTKAILCQGGLIGRAPLRAEVGDLVCRLDAADVWLLVRLDQYGLKIVGQVSIAMVHSTSQLKLSEPFSVAPGKGDVGSPLSSVPDTSFYLEPGVLLYLSQLSQIPISGFTKGSEVTESWLPDSTHHTNKVGRREDIPPYF